MSNKTQLQTNNTALDGYIARINAAKEIAAGLPEAGGSGGGSVVSGIFTITETMGDGPGLYVYTLASTELHSSSRLFIEIYYVDKSGYNHFTAYVFSRSNTTEAFTVRKGSFGDMNFGSANSLTLNENTLIGSGNIASGTTVYFTAI